jgi:hypothetical protein
MMVATTAIAVSRSVKFRVLVVRGAVVCMLSPEDARPCGPAVSRFSNLSERLVP